MDLTPLQRYIVVVLGGALGSAIRYWAAMQFGARPSTTFMVNITGSFLIGVLAATVSDQRIRLLLGAGFLGGYTTFSTWQLEALLQLREGAHSAMAANLAGSTVAGLLAVALGYALGMRLR